MVCDDPRWTVFPTHHVSAARSAERHSETAKRDASGIALAVLKIVQYDDRQTDGSADY